MASYLIRIILSSNDGYHLSPSCNSQLNFYLFSFSSFYFCFQFHLFIFIFIFIIYTHNESEMLRRVASVGTSGGQLKSGLTCFVSLSGVRQNVLARGFAETLKNDECNNHLHRTRLTHELWKTRIQILEVGC